MKDSPHHNKALRPRGVRSSAGLGENAPNPRWGAEPQGAGPWALQRYPEERNGHLLTVESDDDYDVLWRLGNQDWRDDGHASRIVDWHGVTVAVFD